MINPTMGTKRVAEPRAAYAVVPAEPQRVSLADALFTDTQQRVLRLLFGQPERSFYANEVIVLARGGTGAVQRELARLEKSELVTVALYGRQKHYRANAASPIFAELCSIATKTMGLADPLRIALAPLAARIGAAFIYGSVAKRRDTASSDIDLMIVSNDVTYGELVLALDALSQRLGRTVNPTIYTPKELAQRVKQGDAFVRRVLEQDKIWLIGDEHALGL